MQKKIPLEKSPPHSCMTFVFPLLGAVLGYIVVAWPMFLHSQTLPRGGYMVLHEGLKALYLYGPLGALFGGGIALYCVLKIGNKQV